MINKRKYQLGGAAPVSQEEQVKQVVSLISLMTGEQPETVMAAIQAGGENFKQVLQALEQGDTQGAKQMIQQLASQGQQEARIARRGAKLQYIKDLKGTCPDGTHLEYYKAGGRLCKKCMKNQEGGELEQEKKGGVLAQYKNKVNKDCGGAKMKKHQIGGTLETLRESLGLEKKNLIKALQGTKVEPKNRWDFDRREKDLGNGYKILSDWIYQSYNNGQYMGDMSPTVAGRTIYVTPQLNDTVFWRNPDRYTTSSTSGGFMPIPDKSRNQLAAKSNFYRWTRKTTPFGNNTGEYKLSNQARNRALRGN